MYGRFPLFVSYIAISALSSLLRLLVVHFLYVRFFVYWGSELLLILLSIAALNQVFWYTYEEVRFLWWFRWIYYVAILVVLGFTIRMAIVSPTVQEHPLISFILDAVIAANMVRAGIVAVFAAMVEPMTIEFERYPFGIILGFGASSIGPVLAFFVIYISGTRYEHPAKIFAALSYIVALIMWLRVFSLPDTVPKKMEPPIPPEQMWDTLDGYLKALGFPRKRKRKDDLLRSYRAGASMDMAAIHNPISRTDSEGCLSLLSSRGGRNSGRQLPSQSRRGVPGQPQ